MLYKFHLYYIRSTNLGLMTIATYMSRYHWILLVIIPRRNHVIYLDSLVHNNHDFSILQGILERYAHFLHT